MTNLGPYDGQQFLVVRPLGVFPAGVIFSFRDLTNEVLVEVQNLLLQSFQSVVLAKVGYGLEFQAECEAMLQIAILVLK